MGGLQLAGELGREIAAAIDLGDELRPRMRRALGGDARGGRGLLQFRHLGPPLFERAMRGAQADEVQPVLFGAAAIDGGDGRHHAIGAAELLQIGHVEEQAHVAGASQLVELDHARFEDRARCLNGFFELRDLIARIAELEADFLRVGFNLSELLGPEVALDFEAPEIAEQRAFLAGERIGLALQGDEPLVRAPGLRFCPGAIGGLRAQRAACEQKECARGQQSRVQR